MEREMANASRTKLILAGGVLFTLCTVGISAVYVPQFSDAGRERREVYQKSGEVTSVGAPRTRPGSVYENMNKSVSKRS